MARAVGDLIGEEGQGLAIHVPDDERVPDHGRSRRGGDRVHRISAFGRLRAQSASGPAAGATRAGVAAVRLIDHADVRRMLLAQKALVEGALALVLFSASLVDESRTAPPAEAQRARQLLDLLTGGQELAFRAGRGGQRSRHPGSRRVWYTQDYNVEQFYRDNRLNPIHEGTFGIQAIDLLGRKVGQADGRCARRADGKDRDSRSRRQSPLRNSQKKPQPCATRGRACLKSRRAPRPTRRDARDFANAACYLDAFGHVDRRMAMARPGGYSPPAARRTLL